MLAFLGRCRVLAGDVDHIDVDLERGGGVSVFVGVGICDDCLMADSAMTAAARLTMDSVASDRRPTEPVIPYAPNLRTRVRTDAMIE